MVQHLYSLGIYQHHPQVELTHPNIAKVTDKRYSTASEFAEALERIQAKSVRIPAPSRTKPAKRLVDAPKTISAQMDDEATVNQFENKNETDISKPRKFSQKLVHLGINGTLE